MINFQNIICPFCKREPTLKFHATGVTCECLFIFKPIYNNIVIYIGFIESQTHLPVGDDNYCAIYEFSISISNNNLVVNNFHSSDFNLLNLLVEFTKSNNNLQDLFNFYVRYKSLSSFQ